MRREEKGWNLHMQQNNFLSAEANIQIPFEERMDQRWITRPEAGMIDYKNRSRISGVGTIH